MYPREPGEAWLAVLFLYPGQLFTPEVVHILPLTLSKNGHARPCYCSFSSAILPQVMLSI